MFRGTGALLIGLILTVGWVLPAPAFADESSDTDSRDIEDRLRASGSIVEEGLASITGEGPIHVDNRRDDDDQDYRDHHDDYWDDDNRDNRRSDREDDHREHDQAKAAQLKHIGKSDRTDQQVAVAAPGPQPPSSAPPPVPSSEAPVAAEAELSDQPEESSTPPPRGSRDAPAPQASSSSIKQTTATPTSSPTTGVMPSIRYSPRTLTMVAALSLRRQASPSVAFAVTPTVMTPTAPAHIGGLTLHEPFYQQIAALWMSEITDRWRHLQPGPQGAIAAGGALVVLAFGGWSGRRAISTLRRLVASISERRPD